MTMTNTYNINLNFLKVKMFIEAQIAKILSKYVLQTCIIFESV